MNNVVILLSTFNGDKYIEDLLKSLVKQKFKSFDLLVRDDGSKDQTISKIRKFSKYLNIQIIEGENIGVERSYFELLKMSKHYKYIFLCDQDDYWEEEKVLVAIDMITEKKADLYIGSSEVVNESLQKKYYSITKCVYNKNNILKKNNGQAATFLLSNTILKDILKTDFSNIRMHDWWIYILAVYLNYNIVHDSNSYLKYRQHGKNVEGTNKGLNKYYTIIKNIVFDKDKVHIIV